VVSGLNEVYRPFCYIISRFIDEYEVLQFSPIEYEPQIENLEYGLCSASALKMRVNYPDIDHMIPLLEGTRIFDEKKQVSVLAIQSKARKKSPLQLEIVKSCVPPKSEGLPHVSLLIEWRLKADFKICAGKDEEADPMCILQLQGSKDSLKEVFGDEETVDGIVEMSEFLQRGEWMTQKVSLYFKNNRESIPFVGYLKAGLK